MLRGNDESAWAKLKNLFNRPHHTGVGGYPAAESYRLHNLLSTAQSAFEVPRQPKAQPGHDIVHGRSLLLQVNHVALGEDAASAGHPRRCLALQSQPAEFGFDIHTQPTRLLIEKAACARSAIRVHGKVNHVTAAGASFGFVRVTKKNYLAVLAAHLNQRTHTGQQTTNSRRLTDKLIYKIDIQQFTQGPARAAGTDHTCDTVRGHLFKQLRQQAACRLHRPAASPFVTQIPYLHTIVQQRQFAAYRTDIDAEMQATRRRAVQPSVLGKITLNKTFASNRDHDWSNLDKYLQFVKFFLLLWKWAKHCEKC